VGPTMFSTVRDLLSRFFGSDEVELTFITPTPTTAPAPQVETQTATHPVEAAVVRDVAAERRGAAPLVLRPASQAE
jgi:hypothetical protein